MARTSSDTDGLQGYLAGWDEDDVRDRLYSVPKVVFQRKDPEDSYAKKLFSGEGGDGLDVTVMPGAVRSQSGSLLDAGFANSAQRIRTAGQALGFKNSIEMAEADAKAAEEAAKKEAAGRRTGGILSTIGKIGGAAIGALAFCDQRLKQDIAPLQDVEVIDRLTRLAHQVQAIRERS